MDLKIKWKGIEKKFCLNDNLSESETIIIFEARHLLLKGIGKERVKRLKMRREREEEGRERERESKREGHGQEPK